MGDKHTRQMEDEQNPEGLDKVDDLMDKANRFAGEFSKAMKDARKAVEAKDQAQDAKKKPKTSSNSSTSKEAEEMELDVDTIIEKLDKAITFLGEDATIKDAKEMLEENPEMAKKVL